MLKEERRRMVTGSGLEDIRNNYLLATSNSMRREDYGTMEQFINVFRQAVKQANCSPGRGLVINLVFYQAKV